jgi:cell cycle protein kinase DBF2
VISSSKLLAVFLDYYFMNLGYIASRKERRARFDIDTNRRQLTSAEYAKEFKSYCGRERVILRKRRAKLRVDQFHIIAQVGQGGYGEVFLARKQDTGEICALKKMKKRILFKMDEVSCPWKPGVNADGLQGAARSGRA